MGDEGGRDKRDTSVGQRQVLDTPVRDVLFEHSPATYYRPYKEGASGQQTNVPHSTTHIPLDVPLEMSSI